MNSEPELWMIFTKQQAVLCAWMVIIVAGFLSLSVCVCVLSLTALVQIYLKYLINLCEHKCILRLELNAPFRNVFSSDLYC